MMELVFRNSLLIIYAAWSAIFPHPLQLSIVIYIYLKNILLKTKTSYLNILPINTLLHQIGSTSSIDDDSSEN